MDRYSFKFILWRKYTTAINSAIPYFTQATNLMNSNQCNNYNGWNHYKRLQYLWSSCFWENLFKNVRSLQELVTNVHQSKRPPEFHRALYKTHKYTKLLYSQHECCVLSLEIIDEKIIVISFCDEVFSNVLPSTNERDGMYVMTGRKKIFKNMKIFVTNFRTDLPNRNSKYWKRNLYLNIKSALRW